MPETACLKTGDMDCVCAKNTHSVHVHAHTHTHTHTSTPEPAQLTSTRPKDAKVSLPPDVILSTHISKTNQLFPVSWGDLVPAHSSFWKPPIPRRRKQKPLRLILSRFCPACGSCPRCMSISRKLERSGDMTRDSRASHGSYFSPFSTIFW